jgi:hypothetical protein
LEVDKGGKLSSTSSSSKNYYRFEVKFLNEKDHHFFFYVIEHAPTQEGGGTRGCSRPIKGVEVN